jgi:hypothetical protein
MKEEMKGSECLKEEMRASQEHPKEEMRDSQEHPK